MPVPGSHSSILSQYTEYPVNQEYIRYRVDLDARPIAHGANVLWEAVRFLEDDKVPPSEVWFISGGKIVGKITGIVRE